METRNIHVLLQPVGATEAEVAASQETNSYIGLEQYRLLKTDERLSNARVYARDGAVRPDDILLIMMCLPQVPLELIAKFTRVVYFYDDMNIWKARDPEYSRQFENVSIYISPLAANAVHTNSVKAKTSYYIP